MQITHTQDHSIAGLFKPKGIVTIIKRDTNDNIISIDTQENNLTAGFYYLWFLSYLDYNSTWPCNDRTKIALANILAPGTIFGFQFIPDVIAIGGIYAPAGMNGRSVNTSNPAEPFVEYAYRFATPTVSRNFNVISLVHGSGSTPSWDVRSAVTSNNNISNATYPCIAYLKLANSVTQATNEVIDIYYRIYINYEITKSLPIDFSLTYNPFENFLKTYANIIANNTSFFSNTSLSYVTQPPTSRFAIPPTTTSVNYPLLRNANVTFTQNATWDLTNFKHVLDRTYSPTAAIGALINCHIWGMSDANNYWETKWYNCVTSPTGTINSLPKSNNPFHNVFSHSSAATLYYQDTNSLSSSSWKPVFSGTFAPTNIPRGVELEVVTGGNAGVGAYRLIEYPSYGTSNTNMAPWSIHPYHIYAGTHVSVPVKNITGYIGYKYITWDSTGISIVDAETSVAINFDSTNGLNCSDIRNVNYAYNDKSIYIICGNTGLWKITDSTGLSPVITHPISNPCYAMHVSEDTHEVIVVTSTGVYISRDNYSVPLPSSNLLTAITNYSIIADIRTDFLNPDLPSLLLTTSKSYRWWKQNSGSDITSTTTIAPTSSGAYAQDNYPYWKTNYNQMAVYNGTWLIRGHNLTYYVNYNSTNQRTKQITISDGNWYANPTVITRLKNSTNVVVYSHIGYMYSDSYYTSNISWHCECVSLATPISSNQTEVLPTTLSKWSPFGGAHNSVSNVENSNSNNSLYSHGLFVPFSIAITENLLQVSGVSCGQIYSRNTTGRYNLARVWGWNGTNWELNNPNGRPLHTTTETTPIDGISLSWTDLKNGSGTLPLVVGDWYNTIIGEGWHLDGYQGTARFIHERCLRPYEDTAINTTVSNTGSMSLRRCPTGDVPDPQWYIAENVNTNLTTLYLNGSLANVVFSSSTPGAGTINLNPVTGILKFNAVDYGKTLTGTVRYYKKLVDDENNSTNPYVPLLMSCSGGANNSTTFTNLQESSHLPITTGYTTGGTANYQTGTVSGTNTSSLYLATTGSFIYHNDWAAFFGHLGLCDFTFEFRFRATTQVAHNIFYGFDGDGIYISRTATGEIVFGQTKTARFMDGVNGNIIVSSPFISTTSWNYVAISRKNGRIFIHVAVLSAGVTTANLAGAVDYFHYLTNVYANPNSGYGYDYSLNRVRLNGGPIYLSDIRFTVGKSLYDETATITVPTQPLTIV
jgi:hypothetical protein